jgi:hypothetical protein
MQLRIRPHGNPIPRLILSHFHQQLGHRKVHV